MVVVVLAVAMAYKEEGRWLREQIDQTRKESERIEEKLAIVEKQILDEVQKQRADQTVNSTLARLQVVESRLCQEKDRVLNQLQTYVAILAQGRS
jgi:predicted RNase H-like nuclease (RuvC/YqgF family)